MKEEYRFMQGASILLSMWCQLEREALVSVRRGTGQLPSGERV